MFCLIIIILVGEGGGPQPLVYINHSLTTHVREDVFYNFKELIEKYGMAYYSLRP